MGQTYYFQQSGQDKRYHFRVNDVQPDIVIQLIKESDGEYLDISSGKGFVTVDNDSGTNVSSGSTVDVSAGTTGEASWTPTTGLFISTGMYDIRFYIDAKGNDKYLSIPEGDYKITAEVK